MRGLRLRAAPALAQRRLCALLPAQLQPQVQPSWQLLDAGFQWTRAGRSRRSGRRTRGASPARADSPHASRNENGTLNSPLEDVVVVLPPEEGFFLGARAGLGALPRAPAASRLTFTIESYLGIYIYVDHAPDRLLLARGLGRRPAVARLASCEDLVYEA